MITQVVGSQAFTLNNLIQLNQQQKGKTIQHGNIILFFVYLLTFLNIIRIGIFRGPFSQIDSVQIIIRFTIYQLFSFTFKFSKLMKKIERISSKETEIGKKNNAQKIDYSSYLTLSNEEYLVRTLKLLGVTQQEFLKQTKTSLAAELFPKNLVNPTSSKHFFFIIMICLKHLANSDDFSQIQMWYPPRNVNEQVQFKKTSFKIIQKLQGQQKLPKNILVTKGVLMGDTSANTVIEFLRFLSEIALRQLYLQKHSKVQNLIQISLLNPSLVNHQQQKQNNINRFYVYPFVPIKSAVQPPKTVYNLDRIKEIYATHIQKYQDKIKQLRINQDNTNLSSQEVMPKLLQQKQLAKTLKTKIPVSLLSQNRAFDRRRFLDKHRQVWKQLSSLSCKFTQSSSIPILRVDGQVDKIIQKWEIRVGLTKIYEANASFEEIKKIKNEANEVSLKLGNLKESLIQKMKNIVQLRKQLKK